MYSRLKQSKRALSFVLALALVLNIVLSSGFFRVAVQAADEDAPSAVFYVDGDNGLDTNDGQSAENPFKTIAKAYAEIPSGNKKTVIVICGKVDMRAADAGMSTAASYYYYAAPGVCHEGEVVFTSIWGGTNYKEKGAQLNTPLYYMLMGNTTFENIYITSRPYALYANYYDLCIGEGVTTNGYTETTRQPNCFARIIYLGTSSGIFNAIRDDVNVGLTGIYAQNVNFTMKGCSVDNLYGCGASYQGDGNNGKSFGATINIEGGTVIDLSITNANGTTKISDLNVTIGNASVGTLTLGTNGFITDENKTITYKDKTGEVSVAGFDTLKLVNSNVTVASLDTVKTIETTDSSNLTVQGEITDTVNVAVTKAGHKWTANGALITAPSGTAKNMFTLTNTDGCAWEYADGSNATWTIVSDPDAFYVDGVNGLDTNDGFSAEKPLKTLAAAYEKVTASTTTYIVICGEVNLSESLVNASAAVTKQTIGNANGGIKHPGTVVLTSKYKDVDYRDAGAGLSLGGKTWDLMGNTVLENINITEKATSIAANYYSFYMGEGIGGKCVADSVVLGFNGAIMYNNGPLKYRPKDITFTMKSGTIGILYGTGLSNQGWDNKDATAAYVPINSTLNIEGGNITDRVYCAAAAVASIKNINLNIGGNAVVNKLQSKFTSASPIIHGEITCLIDLEGKNVKTIINDNEFDKVYVIDTANKAASGEGAGTLTLPEGYDIVEKIAQDPVSKMRYAAIKSNGVYTANPFNLTIAQAGLNIKAGANDKDVALCLRAMYLANELVKGKLTDYGISYLDEGGAWQDISAAESAYSFDGKNLVNAFYNLSGALAELDKTTSYRVYMVVNGEIVYSGVAAINPATVLAGINDQLLNNKVTPTVAQTEVIQEKLAGTEAAEHLSYFFPAN